ncbi:MAG: type III pantothenate kinase [Tistlia sp.]|uniref:type III pantothenate kinase n=1 Tax=Tistlia sp. TaxID=3057121 RepID=UPI0034A58D87
MLLVVDIGNTNVVFAVYDGETQRGRWRVATDARRSGDEYAVLLSQFLSLGGLAPQQIEAAMISNVVPAVQRPIEQLCRQYLGREPISVEQAIAASDFAIRIARPEQVGADRIANAVAAHRSYGGALIVVDFGTATTFDLVDPDGAYSGGIIAPGINLSIDALYAAAARLPRIALERPREVVGHDTVSAMQSGVFWGYVGLVEGLIARIKAERGEEHRVIATGGLAPLFNDTTTAIDEVDDDLTLRGLMLMHQALARRQQADRGVAV